MTISIQYLPINRVLGSSYVNLAKFNTENRGLFCLLLTKGVIKVKSMLIVRKEKIKSSEKQRANVILEGFSAQKLMKQPFLVVFMSFLPFFRKFLSKMHFFYYCNTDTNYTVGGLTFGDR